MFIVNIKIYTVNIINTIIIDNNRVINTAAKGTIIILDVVGRGGRLLRVITNVDNNIMEYVGLIVEVCSGYCVPRIYNICAH